MASEEPGLDEPLSSTLERTSILGTFADPPLPPRVALLLTLKNMRASPDPDAPPPRPYP
jgi:hypothetical protein